MKMKNCDGMRLLESRGTLAVKMSSDNSVCLQSDFRYLHSRQEAVDFANALLGLAARVWPLEETEKVARG